VRSTSISLILLLALVVISSTIATCAQQGPPFGPQEPKDEQREKIEKDMAEKANEQRQAEIRRDSERLLKLATELKQYVDKSNENILSLEVVKKAEEIEKLAHSVKEKMKAP
jgi:predicted small lipoprotein YifL